MESVIYLGTTYENHNAVPFDKEDQKFIKQIAGWGKIDRAKDKRAPKIQHCYALLLRKGLNSIPAIPDKPRWLLKYYELRPLELWLEINTAKEYAENYLEPLRVAKQIFIENN